MRAAPFRRAVLAAAVAGALEPRLRAGRPAADAAPGRGGLGQGLPDAALAGAPGTGPLGVAVLGGRAGPADVLADHGGTVRSGRFHPGGTGHPAHAGRVPRPLQPVRRAGRGAGVTTAAELFERRVAPGRALGKDAELVARACHDMARRFAGGGKLVVFGSGAATAPAGSGPERR